MAGGYMGKSLEIDLSSGAIKKFSFSREERELYLGGRGLATRYLYQNTQPGYDPLGEDALLIFGTGPINGTSATQTNRFTITAKSPLTGGIATSACGGNFCTKLKKAGYDLVVIRGKAKTPVIIEIDQDMVRIKKAGRLWGKGTYSTQEALPGQFGKAVIGPAGENLVKYACIVSEERVAGRAGMGAVMGSKNLKAIMANGKSKVEIIETEKFREFQKFMTRFMLDHPMTGDVLPRLGTANLVRTTAGKNIIPTFNFRQGRHPETAKISGEELADKHLEKTGGCTSCAIKCGRVVKVDGKLVKGPEFETLALLSNNLGNFKLTNINRWNYICDDLGIDTISCGNSIGFVMELTEKGLLNSPYRFGKTDNIEDLLHSIAHRQGLGNDIAEGVRSLSEKYGGKEFACHVKGLELPGYDPRGCYGQGLEYATTNRGGCHIQGSTMYLEATGFFIVDPHSIKAKPELVVLQQNTNAAISSLIMCYFSAYAMIPGLTYKMKPHGLVFNLLSKLVLNSGPVLQVMLKYGAPIPLLWFERYLGYVKGRTCTMGEFVKIGERIFNMERLFNLREGFSRRDDILPPRLLNDSTFPGIKGGVPLNKLLPRYYRVRGWDQSGVPTHKTLQKLEIRL